jgi:outer membrane receptor protein involved in Fe transport
MHAAFGMYSQVPSFDQLYHMEDNSFSSSTPFGGNPDLELQKTTQYEMGFTHSFSEGISVDLTGYFKEMNNLVETDIFTQQSVGQYGQYVSTGSGESRGLELTFKGTGTGFLSWDAGYTLSRATGSSSLPLQNYLYALHGYQNGDQEQYLDWDQRHTVNLGLAMEVPRGRGLRIGGVPVFQGMDVGLQWEFGSGFPYTHYDQNQFVDVNTMRYPATNSADLKISKRFWLESFSMDLWCEVTNLFDRRNVVDIQDIAWYLAYLQMGDDDDDKDPTGPYGNPYAFSMQRMVRFGLGLNW